MSKYAWMFLLISYRKQANEPMPPSWFGYMKDNPKGEKFVVMVNKM